MARHPTMLKWTCLFTVTLVASLGVLFAFVPSSRGANFIVNTTDNLNDGVCDAVHCGLLEAINAANASPGLDTIAFNIPGPGVKSINPPVPRAPQHH